MNKIELADKSHKLNHSKKKKSRRAETTENKLENKKDSVALSSQKVSLSEPKASKKSPNIRMDLVKKFKNDINKGTYRIKTNEIAEKLIQKYKEQTFYKPYS